MRRLLLTLALVASVITPATTNAALITDAMKGRVLYRAISRTANPDRAYTKLTTAQRRYVRAYLRPATVTSRTGPRAVQAAQATGGSCYSQPFIVSGEGVLGNDLWSFRQTAYWCWAGGRITSYHFTTRGAVHSLLWEYKGITDKVAWGGIGQTSVGQYVQGTFQVCIVFQGWGCFQNETPWISQEMFARSTGIEDGGR